MAKKKLSVLVDETIYDSFVAECNANNFKVSEVIISGIAEKKSFIALAIAKKEKDLRDVKESQLLKLSKELRYNEADFKKLLKSSKPAEVKPAKEEEVLESRRAHQGTYEGKPVTWEVDKYTDGYFCRTSDGKLHKKDVYGTLLS